MARLEEFIIMRSVRELLFAGAVAGVFLTRVAEAQINGVAANIPDPGPGNVIVQLFNWRFNDIAGEVENLHKFGYGQIHVSPPEKSVDKQHTWWERYQPLDYTVIDGPLGSEAEFKAMADKAHQQGLKIIVDVVLNHTISFDDSADGKVTLDPSGKVLTYQLPLFQPGDFHTRCNADSDGSIQGTETCWLSNELMDLRTETEPVRDRAKQYLNKLISLGADGFRFDAARNIEESFFPAVMEAAPQKYAFGEFIDHDAANFGPRPNEMDYYDFPLLATMKTAFEYGGDLRPLAHLNEHQALPPTAAVTLVRDHDIAVGQLDQQHGLHDQGLSIGDQGPGKRPNRDDVRLAYAYILGREEGLPYVLVGPKDGSLADDPTDDPSVLAALRFHNLCLAGYGNVDRRPDFWVIETPTALGWRRGDDRLAIINKSDQPLTVSQQVGLQPGTYENIRTGDKIQVGPAGAISQLQVPARSAAFYIKS
jgi:alpha-amylase